MKTLSEIRAGLADTVRAAGIGVYTYAQVRDKGHLPAVVIEPIEADFDKAMQRGMDTWQFNLFVLVKGIDEDAAQRKLDSFVTGSGPNSIRQIIFENKHLGLGDEVNAHVYALKSYGGEFKWNKVEHIGAILKVTVHVDN